MKATSTEQAIDVGTPRHTDGDSGPAASVPQNKFALA